MYRLAQLVSVLSLATLGLAQRDIPTITPFAVDGVIVGCTPDGDDHNAGGTIEVNGFTITVPKNLIAQFPVAWVPFKDMCLGTEGYEVSIAGNMVNGKPIAAQIGVGSPVALEGSQGYISEVNIPGAYLQIKDGPKLRINDPDGTFAKKLESSEHPLFPADTGSPSITAFSGFPMCIPRSDDDPLCPNSNRPAGSSNFEAPDGLVASPFRAGDFIEYSGLKSTDGILAWAITAINVQITTKASDPNYIRMEDALIGVFDNANNVEVADVRFIGFLSRCAGAAVSISAIDVDPCTGKETYREIGVQTPRAGDARCKWEFRVDTTGPGTYTREYLIKANSDVQTTTNGIRAGQYYQPVTEWIQPEVDVPGSQPPPFRFDSIRGLVQGDYLDGEQFGPLSPFPGPNPPAPEKTCTGTEEPDDGGGSDPSADPVVEAAQFSAAQRVGAQIFLSASNKAQAIPANNLVWEWTQTQTTPSSPAVTLQNANAATATFTAPKPAQSGDTKYTFEVKLSLKSDSSKSSKANVTVTVNPTAPDVVVVDVYKWESRQSGTIDVQCHSNVVNNDVKGMDLWLSGGATKLKMTAGSGPGKWLYQNRNVKQPTNVQCVSGLGGKSAVVTATTARRRSLRGLLGTN